MRSLRIAALGVIWIAVATNYLQAQSLGPAQASAEAPAKAGVAPAVSDVPADLQAVVKKQFGSNFMIAMTPGSVVMTHITHENDSPWAPLLTGDLDGDGIEDALILVRGKDAIGGASLHDYKVIDPMNSYFGWGNPKVTSSFSAEDPVYNLMVLVIHGAGKDAWRAEKPKAKFVMINLRFERITLSGGMLKKKPIAAVRVEESDGIASLVVWDGKKYRYAPGAAGGG